jgi:hypothetical protein
VRAGDDLFAGDPVAGGARVRLARSLAIGRTASDRHTACRWLRVPVRFASHAFVKVLLLRLVGAGVIGFAIFLAVNSVPLSQLVQRWQPAPQGANPCGPIFHPKNAHCDQVHH